MSLHACGIEPDSRVGFALDAWRSLYGTQAVASRPQGCDSVTTQVRMDGHSATARPRGVNF